MSDDQAEHKQAMQETQKTVHDAIKNAKEKRGVFIYLFGNGKGKSSSAFGTLMRSVGHGKKAVAVQFIKGTWKTGEEQYFQSQDAIEHLVMGSGFTWDTQDKEKDIQAAINVWSQAKERLKDDSIDLVVLDEITYMFDYGYLDLQDILSSIANRPHDMNVIVTGRSAIPEIIEQADTVSEIKEIKHAFNAGVKAQKGIEF